MTQLSYKNIHDKTYLAGAMQVLDESQGIIRSDRTGVGTVGTFGLMQTYDQRNGVPFLTSKRVAIKSVITELLWFIAGSGDERELARMLHGTTDPSVRTIWTDNVNDPRWIPRQQFPGDCGQIYGVQWRSWKKYTELNDGPNGTVKCLVDTIDQLQRVIDNIQTNPFDRRHIVSAWNVAELEQMVLPPCHYGFQFYVVPDQNGKPHSLDLMFNQRSNDYFLGCPFNIASYSVLLHMVAQICKLKPRILKHVSGDVHIYSNHREQLQEQIRAQQYAPPTLKLNDEIRHIDDFKLTDIVVENYQSSAAIKAPMAV